MNTIETTPAKPGRTRRTHSAEFKAHAVAACRQPGVSMAAVALAHGINANLLRRWAFAETPALGNAVPAVDNGGFIALPVPSATLPSVPPTDIRVEVRRGAMTVNVTWPTHAAGDCAIWLRELLR